MIFDYSYFKEYLDGTHIIKCNDIKLALIERYQKNVDDKFAYQSLLDSYIKMIMKNASSIGRRFVGIDVKDLIQSGLIGFEMGIRKVDIELVQNEKSNIDAYLMKWSDEYMHGHIRKMYSTIRTPKAKLNTVRQINKMANEEFEGDIEKAIHKTSNGDDKLYKKLSRMVHERASFHYLDSPKEADGTDGGDASDLIERQIYHANNDVFSVHQENAYSNEQFSEIYQKLDQVMNAHLTEIEKNVFVDRIGVGDGYRYSFEELSKKYQIDRDEVRRVYRRATVVMKNKSKGIKQNVD